MFGRLKCLSGVDGVHGVCHLEGSHCTSIIDQDHALQLLNHPAEPKMLSGVKSVQETCDLEGSNCTSTIGQYCTLCTSWTHVLGHSIA